MAPHVMDSYEMHQHFFCVGVHYVIHILGTAAQLDVSHVYSIGAIHINENSSL